MTNFRIYDIRNGSERYVNGHIVSVEIDASPLISEFLLSESITTQPESSDPRFLTQAPRTLYLGANAVSKVFLWTKTITDDVSTDTNIRTIRLLQSEPSATISLSGIIENYRLRRDLLGTAIEESPGVVGYLLSDSVCTFPAMFQNTKPTTFGTFAADLHTVYLWLKDANSRINSVPVTQYAFTPEDRQIAHHPEILFLTENLLGITNQKNLVAIRNNVRVTWYNIKFCPLNKNFSSFDIYDDGQITISAEQLFDTHLLADPCNYDYILIEIEKRFENTPTVYYGRNLVYTRKDEKLLTFSEDIQIEKNKIAFRARDVLHPIRIFDFVSDANNRVSLELSDYDYCFAGPILTDENSRADGNYGSFYDTRLNEGPAFSEPISIAVELEDKELSLLTTFCQLEVTFTKKQLDRMDVFGYPQFYIEEGDYSGTLPIHVTHTNILVPDLITEDNNPSFEFNVINPANTFAEFTIEIDTSPDFANPTILGFRIKETNLNILTLEALAEHEINFLDATVSLPFGTIYWRVRRNQSDWSDPATITVRSAPVFRLEFTVDSQFIQQIGQVATVKVKAIDALSNPIEGARIDFDVPRGSAPNFVNTDGLGIAQANVTMPTTVQSYLLTSESESHTITHVMTAINPPHFESLIQFSRTAEPPPVVRYIIYRKAYAEADEDSDRILQISQMPTSPIERRDSNEFQPGVVFDPEHAGLKMARDELSPKPVDSDSNTVQISEDGGQIRIEWQPPQERGTTWHYDAKAATNIHVLSEELAVTASGGNKFDVITTGLADGVTPAASPYDAHGQIFSTYKIRRFDPLHSLPQEKFISSTTVTHDSAVSTQQTPDDVIALSATTTNYLVGLQWTNPPTLSFQTEKSLYKINAFDTGGNFSQSEAYSFAATMQLGIRGVLITKINATSCIDEISCICNIYQEIGLRHGSVIEPTMAVYRLPDCTLLIRDTDYEVVTFGDENANTRAVIKPIQSGILDAGEKILIRYCFAQAIACHQPTIHNAIVQPYDGFFYDGNGMPSSIIDAVEVSRPTAYTYGAWVISESGIYSDGEFIQVLVTPP